VFGLCCGVGFHLGGILKRGAVDGKVLRLKKLKPFYKKIGCLIFGQKGFLVDQVFQAQPNIKFFFFMVNVIC
jgi:hypothetical protein